MEPILVAAKRYTMYPIKSEVLWHLFKKQQACLWTAEEISFSRDMEDWKTLGENEKHFIKNILAFFAGSDGIVFENLDLRFKNEVKLPELLAIYALQGYIEQVHSETYSLLIDTYISDDSEKARLFDAINTIPSVAKKAEWAMKWINDENSSFAERLTAFAGIEGIFFSGSFCAIYWLKQRGLLPGLTFSNELIARDEGMHVETAVEVYKMLENKLTNKRIREIIRDAVSIEKEFIIDSIPCAMIGMNSDLMSQYIEYVADRLTVSMGHAPIYGTKNPFTFMELMSLQGKTNFFEKRNSDYSLAGVSSSINSKSSGDLFTISEDF